MYTGSDRRCRAGELNYARGRLLASWYTMRNLQHSVDMPGALKSELLDIAKQLKVAMDKWPKQILKKEGVKSGHRKIVKQS